MSTLSRESTSPNWSSTTPISSEKSRLATMIMYEQKYIQAHGYSSITSRWMPAHISPVDMRNNMSIAVWKCAKFVWSLYIP